MASALVMYSLLQGGVDRDVVWRVALALGGAPGLLTIYWRFKVGSHGAVAR